MIVSKQHELHDADLRNDIRHGFYALLAEQK